MPALFIAVQCVQCSTMQVKQQKKSSNKWVCAVCNQRQSVLRIHARGYLAREIRNFVQEFNLSRMKRESCDCDSFSPKSDSRFIASDIGSLASLGVESACPAKRRTDWSEYLDPDEDDLCAEAGEDLDQELPTSKPRNFSKKPLTITKQKMALKNFSRSYGVDYKGCLQKGKGECVAIRKGSSSKWSEYLDKEEECDKSFEEEFIDQPSFLDFSRVDEEVHPDFM